MTRGVNADETIFRYRVCCGGSIISIIVPTPPSGPMSGIMMPPESASGDFSEENDCQSRDTVTTSSYLVATQKPRSLPSVSFGGWNHTGASRRKNVNHSCGNASWKRSMSVRSMSLSCTRILRAGVPSNRRTRSSPVRQPRRLPELDGASRPVQYYK
jgi:hypothetical protein